MTKIYNKHSELEKRRMLRRKETEEEKLLWARLRGSKIGGYKFRRQYSVGPFSLDFYCPARKLALELDGASHDAIGAADYDRARQDWIEEFGIRFLRITNEEIRADLNDVMRRIAEAVSEERA